MLILTTTTMAFQMMLKFSQAQILKLGIVNLKMLMMTDFLMQLRNLLDRIHLIGIQMEMGLQTERTHGL